MKKILSQKGVGLIEALIAGLIFAVGITAVFQLQGTFLKNSSAANARSIAMSIAEEKIEDLRSFQVTNTSGLTNNKFYFAGIASNAGGKCNVFNNGICSDLVLPSGNVIRDNISFLRNWSVTDFYYKSGVLTTFPNNEVVQKKVIVTVGWTDTDGINQTASLGCIFWPNLNTHSDPT